MLLLSFQVGPEPVGLDIRRVREVIPWVRLQPLTGQPDWIAGAFAYHGAVVPVIDLHRLTGHGDCPKLLSSRIILLPLEGDRLYGLLAAHIAELREVDVTTTGAAAAAKGVDLGRVVVDGPKMLRILDPDRLLPQRERHQLQTAMGVRG